MQAVLSNSLVASLRPREKPYEVRDARLKGFLLRVQPSGVMSYYIEYGRGKRLSLGRADALAAARARDQAKKTLADVYQGKDPLETRRRTKRHTFRSFVDELYEPWATENIRTTEPTLRRLRNHFPDLQDKPLTEITPWLVEKWRMGRLKAGRKATTVNRDLDDLKSCLAKAVTWGQLKENPIAGVKRSRVDTSPAVRFLSDEEEKRLRLALDDRESRIRRQRANANTWRADRGYALLSDLTRTPFADHLKPMVLMSLNTGIRQGELFSLTWSDVDIVQDHITIHGHRAKSGRTRHVPLNTEARDTLDSWHDQRVQDDGLVFPSKDGAAFNNVRKSWTKLLQDAEVHRFRWHDLRHTFASRLVMAGVDLNTVRELLGHSTYQMTLRYAHLAPEHKSRAVALLLE